MTSKNKRADADLNEGAAVGIILCGWTIILGTAVYFTEWIVRKRREQQVWRQLKQAGGGSELRDLLGGDGGQQNASTTRLLALLKKLGRNVEENDVSTLKLTRYENNIAADIMDPDKMKDSTFADISGYDDIKEEIWELAVFSLQKHELMQRLSSNLLKPPSGILLYGKPGCGKTMLAKAVAKESGAVFIPIHSSKLWEKYVGESNKVIHATFSLAKKLAPAVVFFDEMDCLFPSGRNGTKSAVGNMMEGIKAELLSLWDGITTNDNGGNPILVFGATNHPESLDRAILRRFSRQFELSLPDADARTSILRALLSNESMDASAENFIPRLAGMTEGYSGSDLKELCCAAVREPWREFIAKEAKSAVSNKKQDVPMDDISGKDDTTGDKSDTMASNNNNNMPALRPRPLSLKDLRSALTKVKRTGQFAEEYAAPIHYNIYI